MALSPFDDRRDAQDAFHHLNDKHNWKLEFSHYSRDGGDHSGCVHGSGELGSGNNRYCSHTHPNDRRSPSEHHYLSITLAQTGTPLSCFKPCVTYLDYRFRSY